MIAVTLPDGSQRTFESPPTVHDVAADIGPGLAKAAIVGKIDGKLVDTSFVIEQDSQLAIITAKDEEGVDVIRHSTAHLMAQAVKQLYPEAQVTIGPVIENGFFYDFAYERPFNDEDLAKIESRMQELAAAGDVLERQEMLRDDAKAYFAGLGEHYKVEIIDSIPSNEALSLYTQGDFTDLCRGPHVPNTNRLGHFKLMKVAGAYWRGDSNNAMLTRIYGTAWADKKALKAYLTQLAEAEKRDHRRIGKQLDLFHLQEEAPGMVFWHPNGWTLYQAVEQYMRRKQIEAGYKEIKTPQIVDRSLWERSGHWDKYSDAMFTTQSEERDFAIKPMNCPCHVQVFNQGLRSYRDLPLRLAEFGSCHRNELSGALHGIMRVRGFVQDDAHIFCAEEQMQAESQRFIELLHDVYNDFGFTDVIYKLSTRPEQRVGSDEIWDRAEKALADALDAAGLDWEELPGEGAFYGPKIEFSLKDCLGRVWQCGTLQVDFNMPERLDAQFVDQNGDRQVPVMLHRAVLGSFERFIGILIEHHEGKFPTWLSPVQAVVMNITDSQAEKVKDITEKLKKMGFRVESDLRNEKVGFKIRQHTLARVPYLLVVGEREKETDSVAVRVRGGEDLGTMTVYQFVETLSDDITRRGCF
ncbi:MAG: threonine--tRNA ligase [Gammaproteobacteria bacterium]|nr:threonine--tRNA ligase [Gammaproteobacteria bacterium]